MRRRFFKTPVSAIVLLLTAIFLLSPAFPVCDVISPPTPTPKKMVIPRNTWSDYRHKARIDPKTGQVYMGSYDKNQKLVGESARGKAALVENDGKMYWYTDPGLIDGGPVKVRAEGEAAEIPGTLDGRLFLDEGHPKSQWHAVLTQPPTTQAVYLFFCPPGQTKPQTHVLVFAKGSLVSSEEAEAAAKEGQFPGLTKAYAAPKPFQKAYKPSNFTFQWSADGASVAVVRNGKPLAMIVNKAEGLGYTVSLGKEGSYGKPWDQDLYVATFGK
jgi:hypothetical protein